MTHDHDQNNETEPFGLTAEELARAQRHRLVIIILGIIAIALLIIFIAWRAKVTAPVQIIAEPVHVSTVAPVQRSVTGMVSANGHLAPAKEIVVTAPNIDGKVVKVLVAVGDRVQAGQPLALISHSDSDQSNFEQQALAESQLADLVIAESEYKRAEAAGDTTLAEILKKDYDEASRHVRHKVGKSTRKKIVTLTPVTAPVSGMILSCSAEKGAAVISNSTELFRIAEKGEIEMQANVGEKDLPNISVGASADVKIAGLDNSFFGRISAISPVVDNITHMATVHILLDNNATLKSGLSAEAHIHTMPVQALVLPDAAIMSDDTGHYVYSLDEGNAVARHQVALGQKTSDGQWEVLSGLQKQDNIVASSGSMVSPGDRVIVDKK
ncbi:MAG: efflux RND transporter periplasmic adaptor subunit [Zymomonas mobilis]|uniref:RND family efflux transporter MFP subunit n=1 Tax=Zymomonas mobilis TaxID=542 RepID=A0A542VZU1_ZYMMB|nr:efflux RND transporter periplasmic adaptor subunit [Zymomonas mobilis]TQL16803.1 RND family efflux transporter MFP subunit [Zymomonas mobilis]